MEELLPIVDDHGNEIGSATRRECHSGSKILHPVVHLHIIDSSGRILLQKRAMSKDIQPGRWDTAVGGHVDLGESIPQALLRETREELGMVICNPRFLLSYIFESAVEKELVNVFTLENEIGSLPTLFSREEIDELRFWSDAEITDATGHGILTPNFEQEYQRIKTLLL